MAVLAEFVISPDQFVLADTLTAAPSIRIEIKRVVGGESFVTPYFWASDGDFERFERALHEDEMVHEVLTLEEHGGKDDAGPPHEERFYRVTWTTEVPNLITAVSDAKATILEAVSVDGGSWEIKVLFPDDGALSDFHEYCVDHEFEVQPERVYRPTNSEEQAEYGVTERQQQALEAAYHAGYFDVPREHNLTELAEQLNISRNALSARLRRGHRNLLAHTLVHEE